MLHAHAVERRQLQQRIDRVMDVGAAHAGMKPGNEWIATLRKTRSKL